ncbi:MAG: heme NO-binding domain-containing protein [Nitrospirota bacterium]
MKGIVFTEFLGMVEDRFGGETVERIIEEAALPSGAAYTAVGTYDHQELVRLAGRLSAAVKVGVPELVQAFGEHLFGRFVQAYPHFFKGVDSAFAFLAAIEDHIHVDVRKLYPDAELPTFVCTTLGPDRMEMTYRSKRPFGDLAEGLIRGCIKHFGERIAVQRETLPGESGTAIRFTLTRTKS